MVVMRKKTLILTLILISSWATYAQKQWSLSECVDYALSHNIQIKQQLLTSEYQLNELKQKKYNRLPNLNASLNETVGFGRSLGTDNTYVSTSSSTASLGVNTSVVLWQGGSLKNQILQQDAELKSSLQNLEKAKNDLTVYIAQAYLEVLFADELMIIAQKQLDQSEMQIIRTQRLVEAGSLAEGVLLDIKSQAARENLAVVNSKNRYHLALLNLAQFLNIEDYNGFSVQRPDLPEIGAETALIDASSVYETAVANRPEVKSAEYQMQSSEQQLKISRAGRLPSLTASAGYNDQYYSAFSAANPTFNRQIQDNGRSYVGLNMSIPIFNKMQNMTNIQNSTLQIETRKLDLEAVKLDLRKQIEQAYFNALSSFESYHANKVAEASMQESFRYIEKKFELGRINSVEYNEGKTNLAKAQSDLVQVKYEFIFRSKILDFYKGIPIIL